MKIAYFSPAWPAAEAQNGIATYVEILTRALEKAGHECVIITPKILGEAKSGRVFPIIERKSGKFRGLQDRIRRALEGPHYFSLAAAAHNIACAFEEADRKGPIDVIEIEESYGYGPYLQRRLTAPIVTRLHGPHFLVHQGDVGRKDRWRISAEGKAIRKAQALSSPSSAVINDVKTYYGSAGRMNASIPNPVEIAAPEERWRLESCDRNMILFVGRFDTVKGADIMLNAFMRLADRNEELSLVMIGKDTGVRISAAQTLNFKDYADAFVPPEIRKRIRFLGPVSRAEADRLRLQAFACISASRFECFPYAVTEALALGCPVVATGTSGLAEHLRPGEDFLMAQIEDAASIETAISQLLADPGLAQSLGAAGRQTAAARLSPENVADMAVAFYEQVLKSDGRV